MPKKIDETGNEYGKYVVLHQIKNDKFAGRAAHWLCRCVCGKEKVVRGDALRTGQARSCGQCHLPKLVNRVGFSNHPLYNTWANMIKRCYNLNTPAFKSYGGLGILVFEDWHSPVNFYKWAEENLGLRPKGCSLDRINVYGNYEPGNLRWATDTEQVHNRRLILLSEEEYTIVMEMRRKVCEAA